MKIYLMVMHQWFNDSKGFKTKTLECPNMKEAKKEALLWIDEEQTTFNRCAVKIIPLSIEAEILKK